MPAGEFRADDVGVRGKGGDRVRVEIEPRGHIGEVVHQGRDRRRIGHLLGTTRGKRDEWIHHAEGREHDDVMISKSHTSRWKRRMRSLDIDDFQVEGVKTRA